MQTRATTKARGGHSAPDSIVVTGVGVIGPCGAHAPLRRGFAVTLIDQAPAVGTVASFAHGGQPSYRDVGPLADDEVVDGPAFCDALAERMEAIRPMRRVMYARPLRSAWHLPFSQGEIFRRKEPFNDA